MTIAMVYYDWTPDAMLEVDLIEPDNFLKVRETLTRIGIASRKDKKLFQSCHILHKQGKYFIVHFKELFALDGKESDISMSDIERRNVIAELLQDWGLLKILDKAKAEPKDSRFSSSRDPEDHMIKGKYSKEEKKKLVRSGKRLHRDIQKGIDKPASQYKL
jgi:hypothetical protein